MEVTLGQQDTVVVPCESSGERSGFSQSFVLVFSAAEPLPDDGHRTSHRVGRGRDFRS